MIKENSDLKIFVNSSSILTNSINEFLNKMNYSVCNNIDESEFVVFNDLDSDFDINNYRDDLKRIINTHKIIKFISKGIPFFNNEDGTLKNIFIYSSNGRIDYLVKNI